MATSRGSTAAPRALANIQCRRIRPASQGQATRHRRQAGGAPWLVAAWPAPVPSAPGPASLTVVTALLDLVPYRACEGYAGPLRRVHPTGLNSDSDSGPRRAAPA